MSMHCINLEEDGGMLSAFQKYFDSILIPQITNNDKWGALDENEQEGFAIFKTKIIFFLKLKKLELFIPTKKK